ncbi:MAG: alkaline phosphatase family protein [Magnetococcales bacterium]|nr:alkaline phosphatase family protein [Magnetococcales bacterium]
MPGLNADVPLVLAGPILRRVETGRLCLWLAVTTWCRVRLRLFPEGGNSMEWLLSPGDPACRLISAGRQLHFLFVDLSLIPPLPWDRWIGYDLALQAKDSSDWSDWQQWAPDLAYSSHRPSPGFRLPRRVTSVLHGSCRKPHHPSADGMVAADHLLASCLQSDGKQELPAWPAMLVLTGDQIYADDVAGPMLRAIQLLLERLGVPDEDLTGLELEGVHTSSDLYNHVHCYYQREHLLPKSHTVRSITRFFFAGAAKPIFMADSAHNHLISAGEYLAMYLLVWSPVPWSLLEMTPPNTLDSAGRRRFDQELPLIESFIKDLPSARRVMAHLQVAMIFDDHDISDDWNLHRAWEDAVYGHPFSRRMVGNGLIAYLICQGWGNRPEAFDEELLTCVEAAMAKPGGRDHQELVDVILRFHGWDFDWPTEPPLIVLDTRTRRWHSESLAVQPSGLLDWEAITELQQRLLGKTSVLLVSAAPIFGVKLIEVIQSLFTMLGKPLLVDAENWMAHPGSAFGILNVFRHPGTPHHFVVLSGDVHYSFVYDVELRGRRGGPEIWQICSSGIRNEFPPRLLAILDHLNRWLYSPRSPLNWLTSRRRMRVIPRKPEGTPAGRRLLDRAGMGLVELNSEGRPWRIRQLTPDKGTIEFVKREAEARWE